MIGTAMYGTPGRLSRLGFAILVLGCGSSSAPIKEPLAPTKQVKVLPKESVVELHLQWLDANRLRVAESTILNVNTGLLFVEGVAEPQEAPSDSSSSCGDGVKVFSCLENAPPSLPILGPGGRRAWIAKAEDSVSAEVCVWLPRVDECPDYNSEVFQCYRVIEGIMEAEKGPTIEPFPPEATDSLSVALRGLDSVYLRHRGLTHKDGASACYKWEIDRGPHLAKLTLLRSEERDGVTSIPERSIALWGEVYQWDWRISYRYDDIDYETKPVQPSEHDGRDECPSPDDGEGREVGGVLGCIFAIGEYKNDSPDQVKLGRMSMFKTAEACERSLKKQLVFTVPSCLDGD